MNEKQTQSGSDQIRRYLYLTLQYWYLFIIAIIISIILYFVLNKYAYTNYEVHTIILVNSQQSNPELVAGGLVLENRNNLDNEIGKLKSYDLIYKAVEKVGFRVFYFQDNNFGYDPELYGNSPFIVVEDTSKTQINDYKIKVKILNDSSLELSLPKTNYHKKINFGENFSYNEFSFKIIKNPEFFNSSCYNSKYYFYFEDKVTITKNFQKNIKIQLETEQSTLLWIWIIDKNISKNIDFLNALTQIYIEASILNKNQIAQKTIEFIDNQLNSFSDSLKSSEDLLQIFKQQYNIDLTKGSADLMEQMKQYDSDKKQLTLKRDYYQFMLSEIEKNNNVNITSPSFLGFDDAILDKYLETLAESIRQQKILNYSVSTESQLPPNIIKKMEISDLEKTIEQHIREVIKYTNEGISEINKNIDEITKKLNSLPSAERQYIQINRKFDLNNQIYTFLLQRRMEAGITLASNMPDAKVVEIARQETSSFSGREGGVSLSKLMIIAIFIVVFVIFILEFFKNKIEDKLDVENHTNLPIIGNISYNYRSKELPTLLFPKSSITETFRTLRTNIGYSLIDSKKNIIIVTSMMSGEGKSFIAANLACILAVGNKKTLLIGFDLRKPRLQKLFDEMDYNKGFTNYLLGEITKQELIKPTSNPNLFITFAGTIPPFPSEILDSQKTKDFLTEISKDFDYIILDTPPVGIVSDALLLAPFSALFLYVVREKYSFKNSLKIINNIVVQNKINNAAIIYNGIESSVRYGIKYGYGYGYGYTYGNGYYEDDSDLEQQRTILKKFNEKVVRRIMKFFGM